MSTDKAQKSSKSGGSFFSSIRGKFLLTGALGLIAALLIGLVGLTSSSRNAKNSEIVSLVNDISLMQNKNLANDALYQYYIDQSYINDTISNLQSMNEKATKLKSISDASYSASVSSLISNVSKITANYEEILSIHNSRGFDENSGVYKQYLGASEDLSESFKNLVNNNDWVEIKWIDARMWTTGDRLTIDGQDYIKVVYNRELPVVGKRNVINFRVGGTLTYPNNYYVTNVKLINGSEELPIELTAIRSMSGDGLLTAEIAELDGNPAIKVTGKFNAENMGWEEVSVGIDVEDYDLEKYPVLQYDIFFEATDGDYEYKYGGAIQGVYGFASSLSNLDAMTKEYSKLVVEGKDVTANIQEIEGLFAEIETAIPKYTTDSSLAEISSAALAVKKGFFDTLKQSDTRTLAIKAENSAINGELSEICTSVQSAATTNMQKVTQGVRTIIIIVLIVSIAVLAAIVVLVSRSITRSVTSFEEALGKITDGNIAVRADSTGKDEFAEFSRSLNGFLDNLQGTIVKLKDVTKVLAESGASLEESATKTKDVASDINSTVAEITKGAGEQARDIEESSHKILDMRGNINDIIASVTTLSETTGEMSKKENEASDIMASLTESSDKTTAAFAGIADQVRRTDESVGKIAEAVSLISSIANQTNLLSLNASIEAARAGEMGKGFAVVATEISKLAEQTNSSTGIIEEIITKLSEESKQTVETINEVTAMIEGQKEKVDDTRDKFNGVSDGIKFTGAEVKGVLKQAESSGQAGEQLVDLMTNLSAISEENAASAETTSEAMRDLNIATVSLADTAQELKRLSASLSEDLDFFKIG